MQEPRSDELDGRAVVRVVRVRRGHVSSKRRVDGACMIVVVVIAGGVCCAMVWNVGSFGVGRQGGGVKIEALKDDAVEGEGNDIEDGAQVLPGGNGGYEEKEAMEPGRLFSFEVHVWYERHLSLAKGQGSEGRVECVNLHVQ